MLTKIKGGEDPFKTVNLKDFIGDNDMPEYEHDVKWTSHRNRAPRRRVTSRELREGARHTQSQKDWKFYRRQQNICTSSLREDRKADTIKQFEKFEKENDANKLYSMTKNRLGWENGGAPTTFLVDGKQVASPILMVDIQIDCFVEKSC